MRILITGAAGMIGAKLARRLAGLGALGCQDISEAVLIDVVEPPAPEGLAATPVVGDLSQDGMARIWISRRPNVIFHLAAIPSGGAEADFEKGYSANLDGTRNLIDAVRREHAASGGLYRPRLVFSSTIAVFGPPLPDVIEDDFVTAPLSSYGTQKAMCELLVNDYTRRGFLDGVSLRLPTICVRPGKPNLAASGFFSNIIREPLVGQEAVLPVSDDVRHWHASPRTAVDFLVHAAEIDLAPLGGRRALNLPGVSVTVAEQIEALRRVAGADAVKLIRREPDPAIARLVHSWPRAFLPSRATALGFRAESSFDEIIRVHIEDEL
jgi:nucleoside-diphosphate-sugar epimerase